MERIEKGGSGWLDEEKGSRRGGFKRGCGLPSHLGTRREAVKTQSGCGFIFLPVVCVLDGLGPCSGIFLPWNGDVEGWAAGGPVRKDGREREDLGGRVIRT